MSPEKQRIAIATACEWTDIRRQNLYAGDRDLYGNKLIGGEKHRNRLPDYLGDLNACHEMEQVLTHDQRIDYMEWLGLSSGEHWHKVWAYVQATSAERCTAFIRTLGLWESSATLSESFPNGTTYTRSYQVFLPNPNQLNQ